MSCVLVTTEPHDGVLIDSGSISTRAAFGSAEITKHPRRDTDARGGQRRADEPAYVDASVGHQQGADAPTECERRRHSSDRPRELVR